MAKSKPKKQRAAKGKAKSERSPTAEPDLAPEPVLTGEPVEAPPADAVRGIAPLSRSESVPVPIPAPQGGARLCYGKPISTGDLTVVPVARVRAAGGFGSGAAGEGSGGGGAVDAAPIGYIEIDADGARFRRIEDPDRALRVAQAAAITAAAALGALVALRRLVR